MEKLQFVTEQKGYNFLCWPRRKTTKPKETSESPTWLTIVLAHFGFYVLLFVGFLNELFFNSKIREKEKCRDGYERAFDRFVLFYLKYVLYRMLHFCQQPVCGVPGHEVTVKGRTHIKNTSIFRLNESETKYINLASYNYLGFAEASGPCAENSIASVYKYGISTGNTRLQNGTCALHDDLEELVAEFLGVEDSIAFGMGFATNALTIPAFISPECLVLSDEKNHSSMIVGFKLAKVTAKIFKHNDVSHLEKMLREAIYYGQPNQENNNHKPWKKIIIFVEGVYSMEGTVCPLPEIIALKKKYKAYLYLDEAHSIGAMGKHGRGVVDFHNCNPKDVDILMGTFTKSFGGSGGYIAGTKELINVFRAQTYASRYCWAIPPPVAAQIISAVTILMGKDGTNEGQSRIDRLSRNTRYFRLNLQQMGLVLYGNNDSPVIPILCYYYSKCSIFVIKLLEEKIATVPAAFPATSLAETRIRICLSAAHTKGQLDHVLRTINKLADDIGLRYSRIPRDQTPIAWDEKDGVHENGIKNYFENSLQSNQHHNIVKTIK